MTTPDTFLRNGGTLADIEALHVSVKRHPAYPNLILFKYDQIESPMGNELVQNCRGVILDENDNWRCVARPFKKFFNEGEGHAATLDWKTARVQEKVDGSLIILYWYDGKWNVATSGTPDAGGEVNGYGFPFSKLFWDTVKSQKSTKMSEGGFFGGGLCIVEPLTVWEAFERLNPEARKYTWCWELTSQYNRVVVQHSEPKVTLLGIIHTESGLELPVRSAKDDGLPLVQEYPLLGDLEAIRATFPAMEPTTQEGYVVVDQFFNRIKVKNPSYVALHHARDGFGPRRMLEIARTGEGSEWLVHFPEFKADFEAVKGKLDALVTKLEAVYEEHKGKVEQRDFALAVKDLPCSGALFAVRRGKAPSIRAFLATMNIASLMDYLKLKDRTPEVVA